MFKLRGLNKLNLTILVTVLLGAQLANLLIFRRLEKRIAELSDYAVRADSAELGMILQNRAEIEAFLRY